MLNVHRATLRLSAKLVFSSVAVNVRELQSQEP
jgi:hypothetical protein